MKRLLLIASKAGYQTAAFAAAAERQGIHLDLATNRCHVLEDPWQDGALAVDFENPQLESAGWNGVVAVGDHASVIAAVLAERFGLRFSAVDAVRACRNKFELRERFRAAGLLTPVYSLLNSCVLPEKFPCVLKPLGLSASRGVIRANNAEEFVEAFARITKLLKGTPDLTRDPQSAYIQVEEFIPGREFALEGLVTGGELQVLAIFDKPDPLDGPFFEETIYSTPSREASSVQGAIRSTVARAVKAVGLTDGPIHAECRVNDRGVWMLEIAARPIGGLCARVLRFASGRGLEDVIVRHAVGEFDAEVLLEGGSAVMMIPIPRGGVYRGVRGVEDALSVPGIESVEITAVRGQVLVPLPEGASYLGFIFSRGASAAEAEASVREAHAKFAFDVQTALTLVR